MLSGTPPVKAVYAAIGVVSYGFPYATIRRLITRVALNTLREFLELIPDEVRTEVESKGGRQS
jgi:hypothetical protein